MEEELNSAYPEEIKKAEAEQEEFSDLTNKVNVTTVLLTQWRRQH